jgi:REP element-mobilizing transposase RayT
MALNDPGRMIDQVWADIPVYYPGIGVDIMQIMPNHIHGIISITNVGAGPCARPNDLT